MSQQQDIVANTRQPILKLSHVSKHFGAVSALTDIELEVHAGEVVALVGDNGSGKIHAGENSRRRTPAHDRHY